MTDPVAIAKEVLAADGDPFVTLSLAPDLPPVEENTPLAESRRSYMRIAALIHPDKLKGRFEKCTEAFQCLVKAFECFADPKARKAFVAAKNKKQKVQKPKKESVKKPTEAKTERKPRKKKAEVSDDDDDESTSSEEEDEPESTDEDDGSDEEDEVDLPSTKEPTVSNSNTPIGAPRAGGIYKQTLVGCPNCRSKWDPDTKPHYSLFMGKWGRKVHCQLCLFVFGSTTAIHSCPHCLCPFDYDASMYDTTFACRKCKAKIGFPYYPVNQHLVDQVKYDKWKEEQEALHAKEREERARQRSGYASAEEERKAILTGECIINEECPLCHKRVGSKHRQHVESCLENGGSAAPKEKKKRAPPKSPAPSKRAPKKSKAKLAPKKPKAKQAPKPRKRKRSFSDDDDE